MTFFGRFARRKPLLTKQNLEPQLEFANLHLYKSQDLWNKILWTERTKVEIFNHNTVQHLAKTKCSTSAQRPQTNSEARW